VWLEWRAGKARRCRRGGGGVRLSRSVQRVVASVAAGTRVKRYATYSSKRVRAGRSVFRIRRTYVPGAGVWCSGH